MAAKLEDQRVARPGDVILPSIWEAILWHQIFNYDVSSMLISM